MSRMPTQEEIDAEAARLGVDLTQPGARARVARALLEPEPQDAAPTQPQLRLLSRTETALADGFLVVEVTFHPTEDAAPPAAAAQPPEGA